MIPDKYKQILFENEYVLDEVENLKQKAAKRLTNSNQVINSAKKSGEASMINVNLDNEIKDLDAKDAINDQKRKIVKQIATKTEDYLDDDCDDDINDYDFYKNDKGEVDFDTDHIDNYLITETSIFHEDFKQNLQPFFVVLSTVFSPFNKIYRKLEHCNYGHAGCSFSPSLNEIFSFSMGGKTVNPINKHIGGFAIENIDDYMTYNKDDAYMTVLMCFLKNHEYNKLLNIIDYYKKNPNTKYKIDNIFKVLLEKINDGMNTLSDEMICSQFVAALFDYIGYGSLNSKMVMTPDMIYKNYNESKNFYKIYEGLIKDYNINKINRILKKVRKNAVPLKEDYLIPINYYNQDEWYD